MGKAVSGFLRFYADKISLPYRNSPLLQLLNNKMSFEYGGDILDAFAKPIHIFLFILGVYAALNCSPITFVTDHPAIDKFLRSSFIIAIFWGIYNISDITHGIALKI